MDFQVLLSSEGIIFSLLTLLALVVLLLCYPEKRKVRYGRFKSGHYSCFHAFLRIEKYVIVNESEKLTRIHGMYI